MSIAETKAKKLQQQQEILEKNAKNSNEKDLNSTTEQVELALHAKSEPTAEVPKKKTDASKKCPATKQDETTEQHEEEKLEEETEDTSWDRITRGFIRCLIYLSEHIAAGFGLGRQQTAWYKHCYDHPEPHPRGIRALGTQQDHTI